MGKVDAAKPEKPRQSGTSAPAYALTNLVVAERRRIASTQMKLLKQQVVFGDGAAARAAEGGRGLRERLAAANLRLNELEEKSHSPEGIFKLLMRRYETLVRGRPEVRIVIDSNWQVVRAHIGAANGHKLAGQLLTDHGGYFDLNALNLGRHVVWQPAELAECEAVLDERGGMRSATRNGKGGAYFEEFTERLRRDGLPHTRVLTGD